MVFRFGDVSTIPPANYVELRIHQMTPNNSRKNPESFSTNIILRNLKIVEQKTIEIRGKDGARSLNFRESWIWEQGLQESMNWNFLEILSMGSISSRKHDLEIWAFQLNENLEHGINMFKKHEIDVLYSHESKHSKDILFWIMRTWTFCNLFQLKESPPPLNIPIPTPAPVHHKHIRDSMDWFLEQSIDKLAQSLIYWLCDLSIDQQRKLWTTCTVLITISFCSVS